MYRCPNCGGWRQHGFHGSFGHGFSGFGHHGFSHPGFGGFALGLGLGSLFGGFHHYYPGYYYPDYDTDYYDYD